MSIVFSYMIKWRLSKRCQVSFVMLFLFFFPNILLNAQDTTYYTSFDKMITTRLYASRKYTALTVSDKVNDFRWRFEPNSTVNLGLGATYNNFTLNLAYGFGFLNPDRGTGEAKYLDLQAHMYPKNWVIDWFGQIYKGYYMEQWIDGEKEVGFQLYPNMEVRKFGFNVQHLLNGDKLSLKAAFLQSAWQKKSAGSFLLGFEAYGGWVENEGSILPVEIVDSERRNFSRLGFLQIGPNAGYAHTLVFWKRFFVTGVVSANLAFGPTYVNNINGRERNWGMLPNVFGRVFLGYNGPVWSINANYLRNYVHLSSLEDYTNAFITGNYRFNFVYRFEAGPKLKPFLEYVDPARYFPFKSKQKKKK